MSPDSFSERSLQGIDLKAGGRNKKTKRTAPKSENVYLALLVKVGIHENQVSLRN